MKSIPQKVINLLNRVDFAIVATLDAEGFPHTSCKGIADIEKSGEIYIIDLYKGNTYRNILKNPRISITAVDENSYVGYCIKGEARILTSNAGMKELHEQWRKRVNRRITKRVITHLKKNISSSHHPEATFPDIEHIIVVEVKKILDLANARYI